MLYVQIKSPNAIYRRKSKWISFQYTFLFLVVTCVCTNDNKGEKKLKNQSTKSKIKVNLIFFFGLPLSPFSASFKLIIIITTPCLFVFPYCNDFFTSYIHSRCMLYKYVSLFIFSAVLLVSFQTFIFGTHFFRILHHVPLNIQAKGILIDLKQS